MTAKDGIVFIDEIEDQVARLVLDDQVFHLPRRLLPTEAREGQWLRISAALTSAPPSGGDGRRQVPTKMDPGGDIKL